MNQLINAIKSKLKLKNSKYNKFNNSQKLF